MHLSGYVDDQGVRLAECPVVFINRIKQNVPNSSPPRVSYYVVASTITDSQGQFNIETNFSGPLIGVSWDKSGRQLRPKVIGPIVG